MGTIVHNSQTVNKVYVGSQEVKRIVKNGTTLWDNGPSPTPTTGGGWYGTALAGHISVDWSYYIGNKWNIYFDDGRSGSVRFSNGEWIIDISGEVPIIIPGNSWDTRLIYTDQWHTNDLDLQWEEWE